MFIKSSLCGVLTLLSTTSAFALSCLNDYGGTSSCTNANPAGDCETLGYSKDDVSGCEHYLYCPFDTAYKRCVKYGEGQCSNGYARILSDCNPFKTSIVQPGTGGSIVVQPGGNLGTVTGTTNRASLAASATAGTAGTISGGNLGSVDLPSMSTIFHEEGWYLNENDKDSAGCYKCEQKTCPSGTSTSKTCSGGKIAQASGDYAGNNACYKCVSCPSGYATSVSYCGSGNWALDKNTQAADYAGCYKCVNQGCSDGFAKTAADCGTTGTKGWTLGTDTDAAGCFKCEKKECPTGTSVGCNKHSYKISTTNNYQGNTQCIKCTTCPNNGYAIGSGKGGCDSGQIIVESSDPKCYECKTGYDREQYGCNIEHAITVDADGNPTSDKYFDHCSCYWNDGYCNTAWVEEHGLCKKGDTHCFYCPGPGCNGGW